MFIINISNVHNNVYNRFHHRIYKASLRVANAIIYYCGPYVRAHTRYRPSYCKQRVVNNEYDPRYRSFLL